MGRGTLASGHPSFPFTEVSPLCAERSTSLIASGALHAARGNNLNLLSGRSVVAISGSLLRVTYTPYFLHNQAATSVLLANVVPITEGVRLEAPSWAVDPRNFAAFALLDGLLKGS